MVPHQFSVKRGLLHRSSTKATALLNHFVPIPAEMLRARSAAKLLYLFICSGPLSKAVRNTVGILGSGESRFSLSIHSMFGR